MTKAANQAVYAAARRVRYRPLSNRQQALIDFARTRIELGAPLFTHVEAATALNYRHGSSDIKACLDSLVLRGELDLVVAASKLIRDRRYRLAQRGEVA